MDTFVDYEGRLQRKVTRTFVEEEGRLRRFNIFSNSMRMEFGTIKSRLDQGLEIELSKKLHTLPSYYLRRLFINVRIGLLCRGV